ncbi:MAG TPA: ATP-binding protein [Polyangia bacterium]|nr:ATP-binding protein [Polyangia bacterium]
MSTLDELQAQNLALSAQLRQLVKTESRLYRTQRQLDEQLKRINALNQFALAASRAADPVPILEQAARALMRIFPFEQALGLLCDHMGGTVTLRAVAAHSVLGREPHGAAMPAVVALPDGAREALAQPILFTDEPPGARPPALAPFVAACDGLFAPARSGRVAYLVLPLWRRTDALLAVLVARRITPAATFHEPLPGAAELPFLQLFAHHAESAVDNAILMKDLGDFASDLESRVRARTAELSEAQAELVLAGKMAAIGTLVAGLSHELNNPIGVILGSAQVLLERAPAGEPGTRALEAIERQARRCASLVNALLDFSRARTPTREPHAAGSLLKRVAHLASGHPRRHQVRLALAPGDGLPTIEVCATEIESALLNLIGNAFDATPSGGAIEVRAQASALGGRDGVEFSVRDTGDGIPDDVLPRIFDPFFTTKVVGKGTGLGLSLTRKIVDAHDGRIDVETRVGNGTTMRLWLPASARGGKP